MRSLISLTFDDGLRCQFERALPILDQHDLPATFFLVANTDPILMDGCSHPDWRKTDWSTNDIQLFRSMVQRGHEIGAHGVHHTRAYLDKDPKVEAEGSKKWIEDRVGAEISSYCYPLSHFTYPIKEAVIHAGYKQARWGANASYYPLQNPVDRFKVDCRQISKSGFDIVGSDFVGKYGAENVGDWIRPGCWHVLMFHGIGTVNDGWWAIPLAEFARQMAELAEYRMSGAAEVVTFKEGAQMLSRARRSTVTSGAPGPGSSSKSITVIVCTYNRSESLPNALASLAAQSVPEPIKWEVLVVDNNSTDHTHEVVEEYSRRYPGRFRYVSELQQGLSYARNSGIRNSRSKVLAFVDDDAIAEPDWLWNLTSALWEGECAGAGGQIVPFWTKPIPGWLSTDDPRTFGAFGRFEPGTGAGPLTRPPYGSNMAFRREVFQKYGVFRADLGRSGSNLLGREDVEFGNRLLAAGERLRYEPCAVIHHVVPESRLKKSFVMRWWFWYGRSEVADGGPPPNAGWHICGVPLYLFRRLARWTLQGIFTKGASRRLNCLLNVCYLAGTGVACYKWSRK